MEWQSLTSDKGVSKKILRSADGEPAGSNAKVTLRYSLSVPGDAAPFDSSENRKDGNISLRLGKRKAIRGLEILAASMSAGECASGKLSSPYAYGAAGLKRCGVPPDASIEVELEMLHVERAHKAKGIAEMTSRERFEEATNCKERGNALFKEAKVERAAAEYQKSLRYVEYIFYRPQKADLSSSSRPSDSVANRFQQSEPRSDRGLSETDSDERRSSSRPDSEEEGDVEDADRTAGLLREERSSGESGEDDRNGFTNAEIQDDDPTVDGADVTSNIPGDVENKSIDEKVDESELQTRGGSSSNAEARGELAHGELSKSSDDSAIDSEDGDAVRDNHDNNDPDETEVRELHVAALNNMSLCLLKLGDNKKAEQMTTVAISLDPENHKPLYYRFVSIAQAHLMLLLFREHCSAHIVSLHCLSLFSRHEFTK
jgi:tetratricopeptide (TPR) repeat protein